MTFLHFFRYLCVVFATSLVHPVTKIVTGLAKIVTGAENCHFRGVSRCNTGRMFSGLHCRGPPWVQKIVIWRSVVRAYFQWSDFFKSLG